MEAFNFVVANEDCNLYTYDMRKLGTAATVHKVRVGGLGRGLPAQVGLVWEGTRRGDAGAANQNVC
jgi:hypothetical protein